MALKPEIRILGIDDSPFNYDDKKVLCVGTIYRGGNYLDGLISFKIKKDGLDATEKIIKSIDKDKYEQLQYIMIDGITLAGFNIVDINKIYQKNKLPVIVIIRKKPDIDKFLKAIEKTHRKQDAKKKKELVEKAGKIYKIKINQHNIYLQLAGLDLTKAKQLLLLTCLHSNIPEPIRVSHLIASGIVKGESHGSA